MSLKYVPPNTPSLITSAGASFAPKFVYKTALSSNRELFEILTALFLLIPHEINLPSAPFPVNVAMFFNSLAVINTSEIY